MSSVLNDRRTHPRYEALALVRARRVNAIPVVMVEASLVQVAPQGIRITVDGPLIAGELLELEILHPEVASIFITAEVQWVERSEEAGWLVGCGLRGELTRDQMVGLRGVAAVG